MTELRIHFTDYFNLDQTLIKSYDAFNISLINDLPLFIDPFLLFNSKNPEYQSLHNEMIKYLKFLRDKSHRSDLNQGLIQRWFIFSEIKQTWLGFSKVGNKGRGLGPDFAKSLNSNLHNVFMNFGSEKITKGSHLEKLCLIKDGIGKDFISDFTTNLIKEHLLKYTQEFTINNIEKKYIRKFCIDKVRFNYSSESWESDYFYLPTFSNDYVLLTPRNLLTKDDIWINRDDLVNYYNDIRISMPNVQLRDQLDNYLLKILPPTPTESEKKSAIMSTILSNPEYLEYYILYKEKHGDWAVSQSEEKVNETDELFVQQIRKLTKILADSTDFYSFQGDTYVEARKRIEFLKDVIEQKSGWKLFYIDGEPITRESDLHILYRLTWFATPFDVSREVNDGRGPADYKISLGSQDKTIVEFKLASNSQLRKNLQNQAEIYQQASNAGASIKVIIYFSEQELNRTQTILQELELSGKKNILLIDARSDNKLSASRA